MDFNYLKRLSLFDQPVPSTGRYDNPFDFQQAAKTQQQDINDPTQDPTNPSQQPDLLQEAPTTQGMSKFSRTYADLADEKGGPAYQKYTDFLNSQNPSREDPKLQPGKMQKLSAMLVGMGEGEQHGGAAGVKSANSILDDKYNQAMEDYKLQSDKLATSAGIEEKDMGRRVGILKDIIAQQHNDAVVAESRREHDLVHSDAMARNARLGFTYQKNTDPTTGKTTVTRLGPDGKTTTFDIGIGALTPGQKSDQAVSTAKNVALATEPIKTRIAAAGIAARGDQARKTAADKFENIQELLQWKQDNGIGSKYIGRYNADGKLYFVNNQDPSDVVLAPNSMSKLSEADKQKAKIEYKAAPGPTPAGSTTTIKRDRDGRPIEVVKTPNPAVAAKVDVIGPNGETGKMDAKEFEEAQKHGWKKK